MVKNNFFVKSQGLGNDYIVLNSEALSFTLDAKAIKKICDVHYGIGSDGILLQTISQQADFGLRIFNPDGSEAEKSGNGLRIYCKYLYDYGYTKSRTFSVETAGGTVQAEILETKNDKAWRIRIAMGKAEFTAIHIPVQSSKTECLDEKITVADKEFTIHCVSVGNPHCVVLVDSLDEDEIKKYGPLLETHNIFPRRINVQFVKVLSPSESTILIWERGAGYTLASGSSSCAVACILRRKGLGAKEQAIHMPGGMLQITVDDDWNIYMTGEVEQIAEGVLCWEGEFV